MQPAARDFIMPERLGTLLNQRVRTHVVIRTNHERSERIHQRKVAIPSVARSKQVPHKCGQLAISQFLIQERKKLFLLMRTNVEQIIYCLSLLQSVKIFLVIR